MTDDSRATPRKPRRPKGLGPSGAALWRDVTSGYVLRADEVRILEAACREVDLCERLEEAQRDAPLTVRGSQGQEVASPFISELRQHRNTLKALLGALRLPDEDGQRQSRPGTFNGTTAREAAATRWGRSA